MRYIASIGFTTVVLACLGCGPTVHYGQFERGDRCLRYQTYLAERASVRAPLLQADSIRLARAIKVRIYEFLTHVSSYTDYAARKAMAPLIEEYSHTWDDWIVAYDMRHSNVTVFRDGWEVQDNGAVSFDSDLKNGLLDPGEQILVNPDTGTRHFPMVLMLQRDNQTHMYTLEAEAVACSEVPTERLLPPGVTVMEIIIAFERDPRQSPGGWISDARP